MTKSAMGGGATYGRDASPSAPKGYGVDLPRIFPLPLQPQLHHCSSGRAGGSRAEHSLRGRRRDVNDCLSAINWCSGYKHSRGGAILHEGSALGEAQRIQAEVEARVVAAVDDFSDYDATPKQQDAFQALLRGRSVYDPDSAGLSIASYTSVSSVSMPTSTASAPLLTDVAPDEALHYMGRRLQRMLRPKAEYERLVTESPVKPYWDRTLRANRRKYVRFVR